MAQYRTSHSTPRGRYAGSVPDFPTEQHTLAQSRTSHRTRVGRYSTHPRGLTTPCWHHSLCQYRTPRSKFVAG
eukprot:3937433-Rhodomonas_salina.1